MFDIDLFGNFEGLSIYACRPDGTILGCIDNEIDEQSVSLSLGVNEDITLEFTAIKDKNSTLSWFEHLEGGMYLLVEKIGIFKINQPSVTLDGSKDQKSITANACDIELEDKTCTLELNMGTKTSQEYLVSYDENETEELINPYTGIPYDWLVLYNTYPEQLALFKTFVTGGNNLGSATRTVTSSSRKEEFLRVAKLIPRLVSKITYDNMTGEYSLTEYIRITYESDGETVQKIEYEGDTLVARIDELITYYTKYRDQLSLLSIVLSETGGDWTVGDIYGVSDNDFTLANKKFQYSIDETIRSFLKQTLAQDTQCVVSFDIFNREVNMTPVENIGENTGVTMTYDTLVDTMKITGNDERFATRLNVKGGEDLNLSQINFGSVFVEDLSYILNAKDAQGNLLYVSQALATKYQNYMTAKETARAQYIEQAIKYSNLLNQIDELKYRVPLDDLSTDWSTFRMDELEETLKNYKNLLVALIALYKEDYGTNGLNVDGSVNETFIKTTPYNYDYFAYKGVISEIECAISTFPYYSTEEKWTSENLAAYKDTIKAWEYNWSLYGTVELQAKIDTYKQNMNVLADSSVIQFNKTATYTGSDSNTHTYFKFDTTGYNITLFGFGYPSSAGYAALDHTNELYLDKYSGYVFQSNGSNWEIYQESGASIILPKSDKEIMSWDDLDSYGKAQFITMASNSGITDDTGEAEYYYAIKQWSDLSSSEQSTLETPKNYFYDEYMKHYIHYVSASAYLDTMLTELESMESDLADCLTNSSENGMQDLTESMKLENNFTDDEIKLIYRLYKDSDYSNENILVTSIDSVEEKFEKLQELLADGQEKASIYSRPQLKFEVDSENILGLPEYKHLWSKFKPGNYVIVEYRDGVYVKLRLMGYTFNPRLPQSQSLSIRFSNYLLSKTEYSDIESIFGDSMGSSGGGGSSGSGSGGDGYGKSDDIDITISNTMLAKLLSSEQFGTRVTNIVLDTLDVNTLTAKTAKFQGLANGTTIIDGGCLSTGEIKSSNYTYNPILRTETGSILRLNDGTFSFGGGKLKWNGTTLSLDGNVRAATLATGNRASASTGTAGIFIDATGDLYGGANNQTVIRGDGRVSFGGGKISYDGSTLSVNGAITATSGRIGHWDIEQDGKYFKGVAVDTDIIDQRVYLTESKINKTDSSFLDRFGFTVHSSRTMPYFYYFVRQYSDNDSTFFMIMEEAEAQGIGNTMTSGAVDVVRVYEWAYSGNHLLCKVISTNHQDLPVGSYFVIETESGNPNKGRLSASDVNSLIQANPTSYYSFDDDSWETGYDNPIYETARYNNANDTEYVLNTISKNNLLLSYQHQSLTNGYTYLASLAGNDPSSPIIAINTQVNPVTGNPNFDSSSTILYSNGKIKASVVDVDTIQSRNVNTDAVNANAVISNHYKAGTGREFTISDCNYSNITLWKYIENVLITHRLIAS